MGVRMTKAEKLAAAIKFNKKLWRMFKRGYSYKDLGDLFNLTNTQVRNRIEKAPKDKQ